MKQIRYIYIFTFFCSMTPSSVKVKDFDFDDFFKSLFDDDEDEKKDTSSKSDKQTDLISTAQKPSAISEVSQSISITKKENFLQSLRFSPEEGEKVSDKPFRVKVPELKKKAFLYYTQKLLDFVFIIQSSLDIEMRDEVRDFLSLIDSISSEVLLINRQYLLRTFYHKDFEGLRGKIYNTLTKKISKESLKSASLRSIILDLQELAEEKKRDGEDEDDRLTFEQDFVMSEKKRIILVRDIKVVVEKQLKPILEEMKKISVHSYAVEEKKKKIDKNKKKINQSNRSRSSSSRPSWVTSRYGARGRPRDASSSNRGRSSYGGGGYGGAGGYKNSPEGSTGGASSTPSKSQSSSGYGPTLKDKKKEKDHEKKTDEEKLENALKSILSGYGGKVSQALHSLNRLPSFHEYIGQAGTEYLFNKDLKTIITYPDIKKYFEMFNLIDSLYSRIQKNQNETNKKVNEKPETKVKKQRGFSLEQKNLYGKFLLLKKARLIGLARAYKSFCSFDDVLKLPKKIVERPTFDLLDRLSLITRTYDDVADIYPDDAKKVEEELEKQKAAYGVDSLKQHSLLLDYLQKYSEILSEYRFKSNGSDEGGDKEKINIKLRALVIQQKYASIKKLKIISNLPIAKNSNDFCQKEEWNLTKGQTEKLLEYLKLVHRLQWQIVYKSYEWITEREPTKPVSDNFFKFREQVDRYRVNRALNENINNQLLVNIINEKDRFERDQELFKKSEDLEESIKKVWRIGAQENPGQQVKKESFKKEKDWKSQLAEVLKELGSGNKKPEELKKVLDRLKEKKLTKEDLADEE